jgi:hypothetical protein
MPTILSRIIIACLLLISSQTWAQTDTWQPLFNGKDFSGWDTYLRAPEGAKDSTPIGFNKDPHGVFTISNGVIHISGQDWGAIISKNDYSNYQIRFQIKFGEKKWPPRENLLRDGGLMFHSSGPQNYGYHCWMRSNEMQIQETEIGDFFNAGEGTCEFTVSKTTVKGEETDSEVVEQHDPNGILKRYNDRVYRSGNFENPHGEWTTGELIARGADAVFIVNGFVVNRLYNTFREDLRQQTTSGKLQFQSESGEYFLKNIQLRAINYRTKGKPNLTADKSVLAISTNKQEIRITNSGASVELVAAELIGKNNEQVVVKLPALPFILNKGASIVLPVLLKSEGVLNNDVHLRLETVLGPIPDFDITLQP